MRVGIRTKELGLCDRIRMCGVRIKGGGVATPLENPGLSMGQAALGGHWSLSVFSLSRSLSGKGSEMDAELSSCRAEKGEGPDRDNKLYPKGKLTRFGMASNEKH